MPDFISVILPIRNQTERFQTYYNDLRQVLGTRRYELLVIDDGSTDGSMPLLRSLAARDPNLHVVRFGRPFGMSAALAAGFARARGTVIVTVDIGGNADISALPTLVDALAGGYDMVVGTRAQRSFAQRFENWLIAKATTGAAYDYASPIKVYRADLAHELALYENLFRLTPVLAHWQGAKIASIDLPIQAGAGRRPRVWQAVPLLLDLVTVRFLHRYGSRPMQSLGRISGVLLLAALLLFGYLGVVKFGLGQNIGDRPLLLLGVVLAAVGVQFLVLGLLAEMLVRVYYEVQHKPTYSIREILNAKPAVVRTLPAEPEYAGEPVPTGVRQVGG